MSADRDRERAFRRLAGSLTVITVLGHTVLGFEQSCLAPVVGVLTGVTAELVLETVEAWSRRRRPRYLGVPRARVAGFLLPSYVCGLLCAMLLYGNGHLMPIALAALVGVGGTYVFRVRAPGTVEQGLRAEDVPGSPFLNPAAFGIVCVLLLLPWVGLAPAHQFTAWVSGPFDLIVPIAVLAWGTAVNARLAGRLPLLLGWTGGFALQALVRGALTDVSTVSALLPMTGTAFALYAGYVLVEPGTSPARPREQVVFGLATAMVHGLLVQSHVVSGLLFALVIVGAGRGLRAALPPHPRLALAAHLHATLPVRLRAPGAGGRAGPGRTAGPTPAGTSSGEISRCRDRPVRAPAATPPAGPP